MRDESYSSKEHAAVVFIHYQQQRGVPRPKILEKLRSDPALLREWKKHRQITLEDVERWGSLAATYPTRPVEGAFYTILTMDGVQDNKICEPWDRLVLLLIAQPREGWESEFEEITRREIERLAVLAGEQVPR